MRSFVVGVLVGGIVVGALAIGSRRAEVRSVWSIPYALQFQKTATPNYNKTDVEWLARNIYFESRGESVAGMLAVGLVVDNRIKDTRYPHTVKGVVTESALDRKGGIIPNRCQFSWFCDGIPDEPNRKSHEWQMAQELAIAILSDQVFDFTDGATNFHNEKVSPKWKLQEVAKIDNHTFYRSFREGE